MSKLINHFHHSVLIIVSGGILFIAQQLNYCIKVIKSGNIWFLTVFVVTIIVEILVLWLAAVDYPRKAVFFNDKRSVKRDAESFLVILSLLILGLFIGMIYTKSFLYETIEWLCLSFGTISYLWFGLIRYHEFKSSLAVCRREYLVD